MINGLIIVIFAFFSLNAMEMPNSTYGFQTTSSGVKAISSPYFSPPSLPAQPAPNQLTISDYNNRSLDHGIKVSKVSKKTRILASRLKEYIIEGPDQQQCKVCNKNHLALYMLVDHILVEHLKQPPTCTQCKSEFSSRITLRFHQRKFQCEQCEKFFCSDKLLKKHIRKANKQKTCTSKKSKSKLSTTTSTSMEVNPIIEKSLSGNPFNVKQTTPEKSTANAYGEDDPQQSQLKNPSPYLIALTSVFDSEEKADFDKEIESFF